MFKKKKEKTVPPIPSVPPATPVVPVNDISKELRDIVITNLSGLPRAETARLSGASNLYEKTKEDIGELTRQIKTRITSSIERGGLECSKFITSDDYLTEVWKEMSNYLEIIQGVLGEFGYKTKVEYKEGTWFNSYNLIISWKETNENE